MRRAEKFGFALLAGGFFGALYERRSLAALVLIGLWIGFALLLLRREDYA